jgi:Ribbon-helix-helix domain
MSKKSSKSKGLDNWVTFTTTAEQKEWLAKQSAETGIPVSGLLRQAIALLQAQKRKS